MDFLAKSNQKKIQEALTNFELSEYTDGGDVIPLNTKTPIIGRHYHLKVSGIGLD